MMSADFHIAFVNLLAYSSWHIPGCVDGYLHAKGSDAAAARNFLIEKADLDKTEYLLFMDSDMGFPPWALEHLIGHGKKVVTGVGFQKHGEFLPTIYKRNPLGELENIRDFDIDSFFKIDATGAAFLLVAVDVIKKIGDKYNNKWFEWMPNRSEDVEFCARVHEVDEDIWVDTSVLTDHYTMTPRGIADFTNARDFKRQGRGKQIVDRKGRIFDPVEFRKNMVIPKSIRDEAFRDEDFSEASGVEVIELE